MKKAVWLSILGTAAAFCAAVEKPYEFRAALETVHEAGRRDVSLKPSTDEFAFRDGVAVVIPADAGAVLYNAACDFTDYLNVSMDVSARVEKRKSGEAEKCKSCEVAKVAMVLDAGVGEKTSRIGVEEGGVKIQAADERTAAQALYHLEDLMNLRRAPFLKKGFETRTARFSPRMIHSGWGMDLAPEKYIERMAHYGYDALLIYIRRVGKTKSCAEFEDVNAIIRRAKAHGVDVYLYTSVKAYVHPDDSGAQDVFDSTYGEIARAYPEAKGLVLVGESCSFPSKDERACSDTFEVKQVRGDKRPAPGWFPCRDYPDWLRCVKRAVGKHAPGMEILFWTYNWAKIPDEEPRLALIDALPKKNTVLLSTFELPEKFTLSNGFETSVSDYTITCPGPGRVFASEAKRAKAAGLKLYTMCNTGGHTWDFGTSPYQPYPHQWAKRWSALIKARYEWGLAGLMETHHYGWYPNFVSELAKEAFTEGGIPFGEHVWQIAARDFGEENADEVVRIWQAWSEAGANHPPTLGNQYGPFRIGPAYPFNFGGKHIDRKDFPEAPYAAYGIDICFLNYTEILWGEPMYEPTKIPDEIALIEPLAGSFMDGTVRFRAMAEKLSGLQRRKAREMAVLAEYIGRSVRTAINLKRGALAWEVKDSAKILAIAREEYANAEAALPLVDADSRLGFECSMEYGGGRPQIEWKLKLMRELFGF
ncbi:MAG: hypothetical protein WC340_10740 [Kiritimatiellia bacterium]